MKKALIITYYWPPSGGAGVQRWLKFVKYMREFGWEPVVYTPENPEFPVLDSSLEKDIPFGVGVIRRPIWEPFDIYKRFVGMKKEERLAAGFLSEKKKPSGIQNLMVWIRGNFFIPDARMFWIKSSVRFLKSYLKNNKVDVVISTGPPHSMHLIAREIQKTTKLPWLADFRDPWTKIDFYKDLKLSKWADRRHHQLEKKVLLDADEVVVIGNGMQRDFKSIVDRDYHVITNGYDEADIIGPHTPFSGKKFTIAHIGSMNKDRNPEVLWRVLAGMVAEIPGFAENLEIELVGKTDILVVESLHQHGLAPYLSLVDYLPHDEVIQRQQQAAVLLLAINRTPSASMILTGKFFEYLSSGRPVFCVGPEEGDVRQILESTTAGIAVSYDSEIETRQGMELLWRRYNDGTLRSDAQNVLVYSRRNLTKTLCQVLNNMVD